MGFMSIIKDTILIHSDEEELEKNKNLLSGERGASS